MAPGATSTTSDPLVSTIPGLVSPLIDPPREYTVVPAAGALVWWLQALMTQIAAATTPMRIKAVTLARGLWPTAFFNGSSSSRQYCNGRCGTTARRDLLRPKPVNLPSLSTEIQVFQEYRRPVNVAAQDTLITVSHSLSGSLSPVASL